MCPTGVPWLVAAHPWRVIDCPMHPKGRPPRPMGRPVGSTWDLPRELPTVPVPYIRAHNQSTAPGTSSQVRIYFGQRFYCNWTSLHVLFPTGTNVVEASSFSSRRHSIINATARTVRQDLLVRPKGLEQEYLPGFAFPWWDGQDVEVCTAVPSRIPPIHPSSSRRGPSTPAST